MSAIEDHIWGVSPAADRVWAQVSGLRPDLAGKRLFMVMQAYIDDSAEEGGVFVLAGYIANAESWVKFSGIWDKMLPTFGTPRPDGRYHFKMNEMANRPDGIAKSEPFFRVIEDHVLGWLSVSIDQSELRSAIARIHIPGEIIEYWNAYTNPWYITFRLLLDSFHIDRPKFEEALHDEKIDFYFDNGVDKKIVFATWDNYIKSRPDEVKKYYGSVPRFEDDMEFLPLQAADFLAWWVRKWRHEGTPEKIYECDFGKFRPRSGNKFLQLVAIAREDDLIRNLVEIVRRQVGPRPAIIDRKTGKPF
jgi:uncharacterized protein DUF3800